MRLELAGAISDGRLLLADGLGAEFGPYDCLEICCPKFPMDLRLGEIPVGIITAGLIDCLREYCELLLEQFLLESRFLSRHNHSMILLNISEGVTA